MQDNPIIESGQGSEDLSAQNSTAEKKPDSANTAPPPEMKDNEVGTVAEKMKSKISEPIPISSKGEVPDKGLGAAEPILIQDNTVASLGAPQKDIPLPPQDAMRGAPYFTSTSFEPPGPNETGNGGQAQPVRLPVDHVADTALLNALVSDEILAGLWKRIDCAQSNISEFIPSLTTARQLLDLLQAARVELLAGKQHYEQADRYLSEVEYRIARNSRIKGSNGVSLALLAYEVIWAILMVWGLLSLAPWVRNIIAGTVTDGPIPGFTSVSDVEILVNSLLWGGLGGVVGALYALWRHVAEDQDFDRQFSMWYITNPIMGLFLGAFSFLIIRAGLFSLTSGGGSSAAITSPYFLYVMAWIVGFQQNVAYDIVRRVLGIFRVESPKKNMEDELGQETAQG